MSRKQRRTDLRRNVQSQYGQDSRGSLNVNGHCHHRAIAVADAAIFLRESLNLFGVNRLRRTRSFQFIFAPRCQKVIEEVGEPEN